MAGLTTLPAAARAEDRPVRVTAGLGTDVPIAISAFGRVELPYRLRASTSLGVMPGPYVDLVNAVVTGVGGYDDNVASLVRSALSTSLAWRTHVGWRPFPKLGLHAEAGYGLVALGGSATTTELVAAVTGNAPPEGDGGKELDVASTLHMLDVEVGWDFDLTEHLVLRPSIGGAFTFASSTSIEPAYTPRAPRAVEAFARAGEAYLDDTYTTYVMTPTLGVQLGWRF